MEQSETLALQVSRRSPAEGGKPVLVTYQVPYKQGMSIMDALRYIQGHIDPTLAFDCSCRIGICRACAVRADGQVVMACSTVAKDGMRIEPVSADDVRRDLIVRPARSPRSVSDIVAEIGRSAGE